MSEILSQSEIDELLNAISGSSDENSENIGSTKKIKIYDFKRPDKFTREQLRTIATGFELCARKMTEFSAQLIKGIAQIYVSSVDQFTYEEFTRSIPVPTAVSECKFNGYNAVIEMDPAISFKLLSHINVKYPSDFKKPVLKDMKNRYFIDAEKESLLKYCIKSYAKIMEGIMGTYFEVPKPKIVCGELEDNSQFALKIPPADMVCVVTFTCKLDDMEGTINVCMSVPAAKKLINDYNGITEAEKKSLNENSLFDTKVKVEVVLGETQMSIKDVLGFGEGTLVELDKLGGEPVDIKINGKVLAVGEVVLINDKFGVRICGMK